MRPFRPVLLAVALITLARFLPAQSERPVLRWYRGNLHTHTINSDGDSPPYEVLAWYKRHGYHFLALTDHNTFTDPALFDTNPNDNFLLLGGEEITNAKTVHVNAIGITRIIPAQNGATVTELLQASIEAVRAQGGVPLINHPNFGWAFTAAEMLPLKHTGLLEIASGHPVVNHAGGGAAPPTEQMWDELLSAGVRIFGVAVDDAHNFREEFTRDRASPGRAWIVARAPALTRESVLAALNDGDFYASTGVTLKDIRATPDALTVDVEASPATGSPSRVRVVFIGRDGRVLAVSNDNPARYVFAGSETYVRARVEDSNGLRAWTQPVNPKSDTSRPRQ
jgi:predicted metal-dependent phosphoesterase TrpH